jgi:FkbM family methyltransferase
MTLGHIRGVYSGSGAKAGATVYAFEPTDGDAADIRRINTHEFLTPITVVEAALGEREDTIRLDAASDDSSYRKSSRGVSAKQVCGDWVDAPDPTVLKTDVEGGELNVLDGLQRRLNSVRCVYCETHHSLGISTADVSSRLTPYDLSP